MGKGALVGLLPCQVGRGPRRGPAHSQLRRTEILRSSSERCRDSSVTGEGEGCAGASGEAEGEGPAGDALQPASASLRRLPAKGGHFLCLRARRRRSFGKTHLGSTFWGEGGEICPGGSRMVLDSPRPWSSHPGKPQGGLGVSSGPHPPRKEHQTPPAGPEEESSLELLHPVKLQLAWAPSPRHCPDKRVGDALPRGGSGEGDLRVLQRARPGGAQEGGVEENRTRSAYPAARGRRPLCSQNGGPPGGNKSQKWLPGRQFRRRD